MAQHANHSPAHMARLSKESAAKRRTEKIAKLLESSPALKPEQVDLLRGLLTARAEDGAA